jgi:hypothetical protein
MLPKRHWNHGVPIHKEKIRKGKDEAQGMKRMEV